MKNKLVYASERFGFRPSQVVEWLNAHEVCNHWAITDTVYCLHCDGFFPAYKVAVRDDDDNFPTCPVCRTSSPLDFAHMPWWREDLTSEHRGWLKGVNPPMSGSIGVLPQRSQP